jgi:hypothetical protein
MANDDLVGNLSTESLLAFLESQKIDMKLNQELLLECYQMANTVFPLSSI